MRRQRVFALVAVVLALVAPAAAKPLLEVPALFEARARPPSLVFSYRGWAVDASRAAHVQSPARTIRAIRAQIDIVERLGLPAPMIEFMRSQLIRVDGGGETGREASEYAPGRGVVLHARRLDAKKPILLYALLKAYQAQKLPGGVDNPAIAALRDQASALRVWPKTARMLQSNDEFFALTGAAYLYGTITREPYTRADLKKTEPQCYQWLAALFDGGHPRA
jgi:hypothetical protein